MKTWPSRAEIEEAMNAFPEQMVHDLADATFATLTKQQLICVLISNALRQPRVHRITATDNLDVKSGVA